MASIGEVQGGKFPLFWLARGLNFRIRLRTMGQGDGKWGQSGEVKGSFGRGKLTKE